MEKTRPQDISSDEKSRRILFVKDKILEGFSRSQIIQFCSVEFKITERCTDNYLQDARGILKEDFKKTFDVDGFKAEIYARFETLYQKNIDIDDYKECRAIINDFRSMFGIVAPVKSEIVANINTTTIKWGDNEISI
jgi:hypothetical protein